MGWPSAGDYKAALQIPERIFADPRLQKCRPELDKWSMPKGRAGGFAIVYKLTNGTASTAVRVYLAPPQKARADRYRIVHQYLMRARPRCIVDFSYQAEGACIGNQRVPIQTLDWISGEPLGDWMRGAVARRELDRIRGMADRWIDLMDELRTARIAHGDLQHGNVMVVGDALMLVDYDCMCVPDLVNQEAWENGLPAYQHPDRPRQKLSLDLDAFSAWIILIALRAVAAEPALWDRFVEAGENENLLFTEEDIFAPDRSPLWQALLASPDPEVRTWSGRLRASIARPFAEIPPFQVDVFGVLRDLCAAADAAKDWEAILALARSPKFANKAIPADLAPVVDLARRRIECRDRLRTALGGRNPREIARAYNPTLLDDWPACRDLLAPAREAMAAVKVLDELRAAVAQASDGRALLALWAQHAARVGGLGEAAAIQQEVARWQGRIQAADAFLAAVRADGPERAVDAAWKQLAAAGGHPDADPHRDRAELAARRVAALARLEAIGTAADEKTDRRLAAAWAAAGAVLGACREAEAPRDRARTAAERVGRLDQLKAVIDRADQGLANEQQVLDAAAALPRGYPHGQLPRVRMAQQRLAAAGGLLEALKASPPSDRRIAAAWEQIRASGSEPKDRALLDRCLLAQRRCELLDRLAAIPAALPVDKQDDRWLAEWDERLLKDCDDARPLRPRHEEARRRTAAWNALEEALRTGDIAALKTLKDHPLLAAHPERPRRQARIDELLRASERVDALIAALRANAPDTFLALLDLNLLHEYAPTFAPHRRQIEQWIDARVLQAQPLGPGHPPFLDAGGGAGTGHLTVRWTWRQPALIQACRVAADPSRFLDRPEDAPAGTFKVRLEQHRMAGGFVLSPHPGWRKVYVTLWPVVDLGWSERVGPPLCLGPAVLGGGFQKAPAPGRMGVFRNLLEKLLNW
jgi:hypothetical protein